MCIRTHIFNIVCFFSLSLFWLFSIIISPTLQLHTQNRNARGLFNRGKMRTVTISSILLRDARFEKPIFHAKNTRNIYIWRDDGKKTAEFDLQCVNACVCFFCRAHLLSTIENSTTKFTFYFALHFSCVCAKQCMTNSTRVWSAWCTLHTHSWTYANERAMQTEQWARQTHPPFIYIFANHLCFSERLMPTVVAIKRWWNKGSTTKTFSTHAVLVGIHTYRMWSIATRIIYMYNESSTSSYDSKLNT